jgi:hypothetical protein
MEPISPPLPALGRITCVICGAPVAADRIADREMPPTCGDPECDHRSMGVDILKVAKRLGSTTHPPPSLIGEI